MSNIARSRVALLEGMTMTGKRLLLIIALFMIGVVLVWLSYRIYPADDAPYLPSVLLGILLPLCLFAAALFLALGAPERLRATKG
jgi:hypothetical protein